MCDQEVSALKQSPGSDPKAKRNSGLFSFLRWFRTNSRESVENLSSTGSNDSLNSTGTAASFSFVAPTVYVRNKSDDNKCIVQGPETDTYKARLKQRDKVRERDKDITLRKKYNLFLQRDSLGKNKRGGKEEEDNSRSLPLMTRKMEDGGHRRSNSESSKTKKAGAYLHVKGKRRAPPPPKNHQDNTLSLRRKKRLAPQPPIITDKAVNAVLEQNSKREVISNDSLKLDHGILKPVKDSETTDQNMNNATSSKLIEAPVSPRPWYKRNTPAKKENKYEPVELKLDKKEDKRKSGMMFLTNISELDREAAELMKKDHAVLTEMPEFMRPKEDTNPEMDTLTPKRRSAKDLIAKFNAITNVTKVTVNSAFFGNRENSIFQKRENPQQKRTSFAPLAKSETSACIIKQKKSWLCKKCNTENENWRLVCNSCKTTIKPYFDDSSLPKRSADNEAGETKAEDAPPKNTANNEMNPLERSKTQIGFSALASYNNDSAKKEEREKLKKMLIEMKNSLPKRKSNIILNKQRKSTIEENPEINNDNFNGNSENNIEASSVDVNKSDSIKRSGNSNFNRTEFFKSTVNNIESSITVTQNFNKSESTVANQYFNKSESFVVSNFNKSESSAAANQLKNSDSSAATNNLIKSEFPTSYFNKNESSGVTNNLIKSEFPSSYFNKNESSGVTNNLKKSESPVSINQYFNKSESSVAANQFKKSESSGATNHLKKSEPPSSYFNKSESSAAANQLKHSESSAATNNLIKSEFPSSYFNKSESSGATNNLKKSESPISINQYVNKSDSSVITNQSFRKSESPTTNFNKTEQFRKSESPVASKTSESSTASEYFKKGEPLKSLNQYFNKTNRDNTKGVVNQSKSNKSDVIKVNLNKAELFKASTSDPNLNKEDPKLKQFDENMTKKEEDIKLIKPAANKVSSSAQTSAVIKKLPPNNANFQLMRPKDFEDIYSEKSGRPNANHLYANLAQSENLFLNVPKRFSDIKSGAGVNNTDTLEINRLLRRLENAIAKGDLSDAAIYARELAQLKVNCSVVRQKSPEVAGDDKNGFMVEMYVEDRLSHRGPFPIQVTELQTVAELKIQVEKEFEIPRDVQRWILGKELASKEDATLKELNVCKEGCPIFLYLVAPSANNAKETPQQAKEIPTNEAKEINVPKSAKELKIIEESNEKLKVKLKTSEESIEMNSPSTSKVAEKAALTTKETSSTPRIVEEKFKPIERLTDTKSKQILKIQESPKIIPEKFKNVDEIKSPVEEPSGFVKSILNELEVKDPPIALEEDFSEYDKTLKAPKTWECAFCTLLNPLTANVCLVCASVRQKGSTVKRQKKRAPGTPETKTKHYQELMNLDNSDLVTNVEGFECVVCFGEVGAGEGVTLRECLHQFCRDCLAHTVEFCEEAEVKCPYRDEQYSCDIALQDREVKALVTPQVYEQFLAKSVAQAENKIDKSFHCKTPDCKGWCIFEDNVNEFRCPVCRRVNCLTCQAIHIGLNCKQYQERMNDQSETDEDAKRTREMLEEMVNRGEALTCPACQVILMKKWGCDWVRCSMCKTEICWVTKGLRWGPAGKGDTSGGCKCGVNGVKCHPKCNYCH